MGAGRAVQADGITGAIEAFVRVEHPMERAGIRNSFTSDQDIRGYYETALALSNHAL